MLKQLKHHWKRTVSGLMALVMAVGLLPGTSLAAETAATPKSKQKRPMPPRETLNWPRPEPPPGTAGRSP